MTSPVTEPAVRKESVVVSPSATDVSLVPPERLAPALVEATGDDRWADFEATLIAGGKSNLTYLLTSGAGELVLRRPPSGELLPTAHDMAREVRVQRALAGSPVPTVRVVLSEPDSGPIGAPFYVMERVRGHVIRDAMPMGYAETADDRVRIADALIDTLVALHGVDPSEVGLDDFGRPAGFLQRQLRRWTAQSQSSRQAEVPALDELATRLGNAVPQSARSSIVHGDYRLDNCLMHPTDPGRVGAVLDWEMSTLGDPLADLGLLMLYWPEPDEPEIPLVPTVSRSGGFPGRAHLLERYAAGTGTDMDRIGWYHAFAQFKFAVIIQGVQARAEAGAMGGQQFAKIDADVVWFAENGLDILGRS